MTFNPQRFEYPYGVHLVDDIHNIFPELLYDAGMFPGNLLLTFMQMRVNELFPEEYAHNRTQYRLFQLERRRREAGIPMPPLPQTPPRRRVHPMAMPATPARPVRQTQPMWVPLTPTRTVQPTQPAQPSQPTQPAPFTTVTTIPLMESNGILNTLLTTALFGTTLGATNEELADLLTPVPVVPTPQQLNDATIVSSLEPPADVVCTICQDHEPPVPSSTEWRIIRHCSHRFHRSCIDEWFRQNVHCPVCRHDIREHQET